MTDFKLTWKRLQIDLNINMTLIAFMLLILFDVGDEVLVGIIPAYNKTADDRLKNDFEST